MTLEDAIEEAKRVGASMIFRRSKSWYHRGIRTEIAEPEDIAADDWEVCFHHGMRIMSL